MESSLLDLLNYIVLYMCNENFGLTFLDQSRAACISVNSCSGDSFNELIISALDLLLFDSNGTWSRMVFLLVIFCFELLKLIRQIDSIE